MGRQTFWQRHGLSLALLGLMLASLGGEFFTGRVLLNQERVQHGLLPLGIMGYSGSSAFASATFENWESEFLQMGLYVVMTVFLRQWGSAESRPFDHDEEPPITADSPWPARQGGLWLVLYRNSLSSAFLLLFAMSFTGHALGSWRSHVFEQRLAGQPALGLLAYLGSADFWFESFQNWQSEFLAVLMLVVLSIFLRQKGSPQSKPLTAPNSKTGT